jgi:outer membrane protein OmpA-like peptidoglycan-associated protein
MQRLLFAITLALCPNVLFALEVDAQPTSSIPISYVSTNTRLALGINQDADAQGELMHVFGYDGDSAWVTQGWLGQQGSAGLQLGYHWLWNDQSRTDTVDNPNAVIVGKAFVAVDQNIFKDRKISLGWGFEREHIFADAYLSGAVTGNRLTDTFVERITRTETGTQSGRPFQQDVTQINTSRIFEHPYDWGIGARVGRFFDSHLLRVRAGLDYERGDFDSSQLTFSLGLEKYISNSGHSFGLDVEHLNQKGDFALDRTDNRAWLTWRYELGSSFRPTEPYQMVEQPAPQSTPARNESAVTRNQVQMDTESFFELDHAELSPSAKQTLSEIIEAIKSSQRVSRINITGHTCDLGPTEHNQKLSEKRASAVKDFFVSQGISISEVDAQGMGEIDPKYPNESTQRAKNRRVDVSFLTIEEQTNPSTTATSTEKTQWIKQPIKVPAAWIERALRNPSYHKRSVDVYRVVQTSQETELGPIRFTNRGPVAVNDAASTMRDTAIAVNVLANDSDPDGDPLLISSASSPTHGTATLAGTAINYTPRPGFVGTDTFSYVITDGQATATANVTVTVTATPEPSLNHPPIAVDDYATTPARDPVIIRVLANDSDPDGDPIRIVDVSQPNLGTTTIQPDGTILFTPRSDWCGRSVFVYTISDPAGLRASARVIVERLIPSGFIASGKNSKLCNG